MTPGRPHRSEKGDSQGIKIRNGLTVKMLLAAVAGAVVAMVVGQFVPTLQRTQASATSLAHLEKRMDENFQQVRRDIAGVKQEIQTTMAVHKEATAHDGALQLLINHGTLLSDHEARIKQLERKP